MLPFSPQQRANARVKHCAIAAVLVAIGTPAFSAEPASADVAAIVRKLDGLYRSKSSFAEVEMQIVTPHWQRTLELHAWTADMTRTLIRILKPKKERGVGTLRIGHEMWNYLPRTNKIIKIPPSMMMGSWMGSDFTNDDVVKEYTFFNDYDFRLVPVDEPDSGLLYLECRPKEGRPIVWDRIVVALRRSDSLPVWQEHYDERGRMMRRLSFSDVRELGGRLLPTVLEMVPSSEKGHKTILRYHRLEFDLDVGDETFSLRHLRSGI